MPRGDDGPAPVSTGPRWLQHAEMQAWQPLLRVVQLLPQALDEQLREQMGTNPTHHMLLAHLSARPSSVCADRAPPARRDEPVARLSRGDRPRAAWLVPAAAVRDGPARAVRRLTDDGREVLQRTAPGHVAEARRTVIDQLDEDDLADLRSITRKILAVLDD